MFNIYINIFVIVAVISIIVFFTIHLKLFQKSFKTEIDLNLGRIDILPKFHFDIEFDPFPSTINVDNPYNCTPTDLKTCDVRDSFSCFGCKNLVANCIHYDKDTTYIDFDGNKSIIKANATEFEGYCMVAKTLSETCNPFHGDLVLTQLSADATVSGLICDCKFPGFIGNTQIGGSCSDVFICDGKIEDLNQLLDKIKCKFDNVFVSATV